MKLQFAWFACLLMSAAVASPGVSQAQDNPFGEGPVPPIPPQRVKVMDRTRFGDPWATSAEASIQWKENNEIEQAANRVRDAEGAEAKSEARKQLRKLLDNYFEDDMQRRAEELARIEERVKKLHALLERREDRKGEIIDLQMKVALNEADGLGFFSQPGGAGPEYSPTMPPGTFPAPATDRTPRAPFERRLEGEPPRPVGEVEEQHRADGDG